MHTPIHFKAIAPMVLIIAMMYGCSTKEVQNQNLPQANIPFAYKQTEDNFWWRCQFKIVWPENTRLDWGMDLLLAHSVISPSLKNHHKDISYWRFHRRAARDSAGHQFSFIFFSKPETAASVYWEIQQSSILKQALEMKLVERVRTGDPQNPESPNIEDASDPNWSPEIQRSWPLFIMGVSSLWLELINDFFPAGPEDHENIEIMLEKYHEVDAQITNLWRNEGQHAFLHHLNAIFGYNPMFLRKMITF